LEAFLAYINEKKITFQKTIAWIIAGLPYDILHGISNFIMGMLVVPMVKLLHRISDNELLV